MTLIESMMSPCVKRVKTFQSDGTLGHLNSWADNGEPFMAAIIKQTPQLQTVAEKTELKELYTVVVHVGTALAFHDVIKRASDGPSSGFSGMFGTRSLQLRVACRSRRQPPKDGEKNEDNCWKSREFIFIKRG